MGISYWLVRDDNRTVFALHTGNWWSFLPHADHPQPLPCPSVVMRMIRGALGPGNESFDIAEALIEFAGYADVYWVSDGDISSESAYSRLLDSRDAGRPYSVVAELGIARGPLPRPFG
jgi:hypothetical protein